MKPKPVLTKHDFVKRYQAGEFGNRSPTWDSLDDWLRGNYDGGPFHLRNRVAGGHTAYDVVPESAIIEARKLLKLGVKFSDIYVSAMAPTDKTVLQGEVQRTHNQLELFFSQLRFPMREALEKDGRQCYGLQALCWLRGYLNQKSLDWLMYLLDTYDDHVVEFSAYSVCWGTEPGFNTVYWEVRQY